MPLMAGRSPKEHLASLLALKESSTNALRNRENSQLEFKETFNIGSRAKYARTMASFANNRGGYIVFGVEPSPHRLKGVSSDRFDALEPAQLSEFLNTHFSPELSWEVDSVEVFGVGLGYIFTHEAREKPMIAITNSGDAVKSGDVYFRYNAQSSVIRYPELRGIIEDRVAREREAWLQHMRTIERVGATNVSILDTVHGKLFGAGAPFLIDEKLLRQLKFIGRGRFSESEGAPTLRVLGKVQPVSGLEKEIPVPVGIHAEDLITAFLAQRDLDQAQAKAYLREATYQPTPFLPLHYFARLSQLTIAEAQKVVEQSQSASASQKKRIVRRLARDEMIAPMGAIAESPRQSSRAGIEAALSSAKTEAQKRSVLLGALRRDPRILAESVSTLPVARLSEAVTHLTPRQLADHAAGILELLLSVFANRFQGLSPIERTAFRKAVAFCDENLRDH